MLIDLAVACTWIAMSIACAGVLVWVGLLGATHGATQFAAPAAETLEPAHEGVYQADLPPAAAELWR